MHRMTIRQAEFEVRTPKESHKKFVRSRKLSESEAKDRVDGAETFLSEDWPNAEKDRELIDAMREKRVGIRVLEENFSEWGADFHGG